mgnify:CR=1 FL=1
MFDVGFFELVVIGIVGLLVLGPERLPHAIRMGSAYLGKFRRAVTNVREEFEREVNIQEMQQRIKEQLEDSGLEETRKSLAELKQSVETGVNEENVIEPPQQKPNQEDSDTHHSATLPENEAEPLPSQEPPRT